MWTRPKIIFKSFPVKTKCAFFRVIVGSCSFISHSRSQLISDIGCTTGYTNLEYIWLAWEAWELGSLSHVRFTSYFLISNICQNMTRIGLCFRILFFFTAIHQQSVKSHSPFLSFTSNGAPAADSIAPNFLMSAINSNLRVSNVDRPNHLTLVTASRSQDSSPSPEENNEGICKGKPLKLSASS